MCCHALLQGIFPTQGLKPQCLPHWQAGSWEAPVGSPGVAGGRPCANPGHMSVRPHVSPGLLRVCPGARTHGEIRARAWVCLHLALPSALSPPGLGRLSGFALPAVRASLFTSLRSLRACSGVEPLLSLSLPSGRDSLCAPFSFLPARPGRIIESTSALGPPSSCRISSTSAW